MFDTERHFGNETAVEQIERRFVVTVVHVRDVGFKCPIYGFGAELDIAILGKEVISIPRFIDWPFTDWTGENEWLVTPFLRELCRRQVFQSSDSICSRNSSRVGTKWSMSAKKWSIKDI